MRVVPNFKFSAVPRRSLRLCGEFSKPSHIHRRDAEVAETTQRKMKLGRHWDAAKSDRSTNAEGEDLQPARDYLPEALEPASCDTQVRSISSAPDQSQMSAYESPDNYRRQLIR
jgi:hypothetical protein